MNWMRNAIISILGSSVENSKTPSLKNNFKEMGLIA